MNKIWVVIIVILCVMAFMFHWLFIMFDYAFHDPDQGGFNKLRDAGNDSIKNDFFKNQTNNQSNFLREFFGYARVICIGVIFLVAGIAILEGRKPQGGE